MNREVLLKAYRVSVDRVVHATTGREAGATYSWQGGHAAGGQAGYASTAGTGAGAWRRTLRLFTA